MKHYEKNGKKQQKHFPESQRQLWNCTGQENIKSDVLGSYSGFDEDGCAPVQDADDL